MVLLASMDSGLRSSRAEERKGEEIRDKRRSWVRLGLTGDRLYHECFRVRISS